MKLYVRFLVAIFTCVYFFSSTVVPVLAARSYTYDDNGNMTTDGSRCFEYNDANQLKKVKNCSNNQTIAEYVYDFNGNRIVKKEYENGNLAKTVISPDDGFEISKPASTSETYTTTYYHVNDQLIAKKDPYNNFTYHHNDHLGSSSLITNESGAVVEETTYDPWGEVIAGGTKSKFQYTGQEKDIETGLNYYNARYYDPHIRRFTQPDDMLPDPYDPQQINRYAYVRNNPIRYTDPSGHVVVAIPLAYLAWGALAGIALYYTTPIGQEQLRTSVTTISSTVSQIGTQVKTDISNLTKQDNTETKPKTITPPTSDTEASTTDKTPPQTIKHDPNRNPAQDKKVPESTIKEIERYLGEDIHKIKGKDASKYDIFRDKSGNLYKKPKDGSGPGDPLDLNLKDFNL